MSIRFGTTDQPSVDAEMPTADPNSGLSVRSWQRPPGAHFRSLGVGGLLTTLVLASLALTPTAAAATVESGGQRSDPGVGSAVQVLPAGAARAGTTWFINVSSATADRQSGRLQLATTWNWASWKRPGRHAFAVTVLGRTAASRWHKLWASPASLTPGADGKGHLTVQLPPKSAARLRSDSRVRVVITQRLDRIGSSAGYETTYLNYRELSLLTAKTTATSNAHAGAVGVAATASLTSACGNRIIGPGADLQGCDLSGAALDQVDLSRANLTGGRLAGTSLARATLIGTQLTRTDLVGAVLSSAKATNARLEASTLTDATVTGADFSNALLDGVTSGRLAGVPSVLPAGWILRRGFLIGATARLVGANLAGADLTTAILVGSDLTGANLLGTNLSSVLMHGAILRSANLGNAILTGAEMQRANLRGLRSGGITAGPATLPDGFRLVNGFIVGPNMDLRNASLRGADLGRQDLSGATLTQADLTGALLARANLTGANLGAANLTRATVRDATITGADLRGARLTRLESGRVIGPPAFLPNGFAFRGGFVLGPDVGLRNANLDGLNMAGVSLTRADLTFAHASAANLTGADFSDAILDRAALVNANLARARLARAMTNGAAFSGSNLTGVTSGGITGTPASLPSPWALTSGFLIGPGANLVGANLARTSLADRDLSRADLTAANLSGANLFRVNLTNARLTGANLTNANLLAANITGADLTRAVLVGVASGRVIGAPAALPFDWHVAHGHLLGPRANLTNAVLTGTNLTAMNLTGAVLKDAHLHGAVLISTNLTNATLVNADLSAANLTNANAIGANLTASNLAAAILRGVSYSSTTTWPPGAAPACVAGTICRHL